MAKHTDKLPDIDSSKDYVSIRVSTLRGDQKINFNAYLKINEKWILYIRNGDSFEGSRLERLKAKKLKKMYILNDDETSYRDYMQKNIEMAFDDKSGKDIKTRSEIIQGATQSQTEEVFDKPENAAAYSQVKDSASKYVDFLINNSDAVKSVISITNDEQNIAHHGVTVSTLAVELAQRLKLFEPEKIQLLALGALLHDYGHHGTSLNLSRPIKEFNNTELATYLKHPQLGAEKVKDQRHFDSAVINIIHQHEEKINGTGPLGYGENKIDPLALVVSAANSVDRILTFEKTPLDQLSKRLMLDEMGKYPLNYIQTLVEIINQIKA